MAGILVYALHDDEGNFNKNSLGALSEAAKLAGELGAEAAAAVVGDVADDAAAASSAMSPTITTEASVPSSPASLEASDRAPSEFLLNSPSSL